jgi:regulator of sigma E protease
MGASGGTAVAGSIDFILMFPVADTVSTAGLSLPGLLAQTVASSWSETIATQLWLWARVALGIGFVIFVHELGHFLAAKWCGVKVEKFYVGFDVPIKIGPISLPRTLGRFRYGETEYGIGTIPLGGYVKMLGQDDDPRKAEAEAKRIRLGGKEGDEPTDDAESVVLDPRSFPAKPVWQRMVIISSGVVMNLITGVLFAMIAFMLGVPFTPAVIGDVTPGGPAYQAGIEPGGKVVSVGSIPRDEQLHFREMRLAILTEGMDNPEEPVNISIEYPDGVRDYKLKTTAMPEEPSMRIIGILTPTSTKLSESFVSRPGSIASTVLTAKDAGAQVIALDDTKLPGNGESDNVEASIAMRKYLQEHVAEPITLTLKRTDNTEAKVTIPPQMLKLPGVHFAVGPVKALVNEGVASKAGVQVGDVLVAVNGERKLDAFELPSKFTFLRTNGEAQEEVEITIPPAANARSTSAVSETDNSISLDRFEFAYEALPKVSRVVESTEGEASEAGLREGDVLRSVTVRWPEGKVPAALEEDSYADLREKLTAGWELDAQYPLSSLVRIFQMLPEGTELGVMLVRDQKVVETSAKLTSTNVAWVERGIGFSGIERLHHAENVSEAFSLGLRESKRRLGDVFRFLSLLVQGKVQSKQVGGPITIFRAAGAETSRGMPALLMFLTLLSMNLAILNFLPIPALDGGHMVFLVAEAILGRPVNEKLQMQLTMAGVLALLSLMVFAVFNDIRQLP